MSISFSRQVHPIFRRNCQGCHQPANAGGGLDLTGFAGLKKGGGSGTAFRPGDPAHSLVVNYITGDPPAMPKNQPPLPPHDIGIIREWIAQGARDDTPAFHDSIDQSHPPVYHVAPIVSALAYSPDGSLLAVSGYRETLLRADGGVSLAARLVGRSESIETVAFSPDGKILAVAGGNQASGGEIALWDVRTRAVIKSIPATTDTVFGLSFSPDGKKIAIGAADNSVRVYSVPDGKQLIKFDNHSDWVFGTAFTSDSKHLVSAGRDQALKLILLEGDSGSFVDDINTHHSPLRCLVRLPKEDKVLCGGDDGVVRLYQVFRTTARTMNQEDHNLLKEFDALPSTITALAISPDGSRFAAGDMTGDLRVVQTKDGRALGALKMYNGGIFALAFNPDGDRIAVGGFDGRVRVIHSTGRLVRQFIPVPLSAQIARQPQTRRQAAPRS